MNLHDSLRTTLRTARSPMGRGFVVLGLVLIAGLAYGMFRPSNVVAHQVDRGPVQSAIKGTGTLESSQEVSVAFRLTGRIESLPIREGTLVKAGDIIGRLERSDTQLQVAVSKANQLQAQAGVGRSSAEVALTKARLERARADFQRIQALHREGILSRADLDAGTERLHVAEAEATAGSEGLVQTRHNEGVARASLALQSWNLEETLLRAPVDGIVVKRLREPGHVVSPGTPVYTLVATQKFWVRTWVDETALGALRVGGQASIEFRSHPGRLFPGRVDQVGRQVDHQYHELVVDVEVLELPENFAVGQKADVLVQGGKDSVLRIPRSFATPASMVWLNRNGRAELQTVKLGRVGETFAEVTEGLKEGDVLVKPSSKQSLTNGQRVSIRTSPAAV